MIPYSERISSKKLSAWVGSKSSPHSFNPLHVRYQPPITSCSCKIGIWVQRSLECISVYTEITTLAVVPIALAAVSNAAKYSLDVNGSLMIHV